MCMCHCMLFLCFLLLGISSICFFHDRHDTFFKPHFLFVFVYEPLRYLSLFDSRFRPHLTMTILILSLSGQFRTDIEVFPSHPIIPKRKALTFDAQEVIQGTNSPTEPRFVPLPPHSPSHPLIITNTYPPPPHRVHSHATTATLINFCHCEGIVCDTILPYLDPFVERLFKLLNTPGDSAPVRRHGQEQAITALWMRMKLRLRRYVVFCVWGKRIGADSLLVVSVIVLPVDYAAAAECPEECGGAGLSQAKECVELIGE